MKSPQYYKEKLKKNEGEIDFDSNTWEAELLSKIRQSGIQELSFVETSTGFQFVPIIGEKENIHHANSDDILLYLGLGLDFSLQLLSVEFLSDHFEQGIRVNSELLRREDLKEVFRAYLLDIREKIKSNLWSLPFRMGALIVLEAVVPLGNPTMIPTLLPLAYPTYKLEKKCYNLLKKIDILIDCVEEKDPIFLKEALGFDNSAENRALVFDGGKLKTSEFEKKNLIIRSKIFYDLRFIFGAIKAGRSKNKK